MLCAALAMDLYKKAYWSAGDLFIKKEPRKRWQSKQAHFDKTLPLAVVSDSMRGQGGRCKPGFFGVFSTGGSRIVSPLGGGVSLLKGAQVVAVIGGAAGARMKMSLNRYCRLRRTPGW